MRKNIFLLLICALVFVAFTVYAQNLKIPVRPLRKEAVKPIVLTPPVPANFSAAGYSLIETEVSWQDNSTNEEGFEIEEKIGTGTSPLRRLQPNSTQATFMYAGPGIKACYRIRAYNKNGNSDWSNQVCATTGAYNSAPPAPSSLKADKVSGYQINLTWYTETMLRHIEGFIIEFRRPPTTIYAKQETIRVKSIKPVSGEITLKCDSSEMCDARSFNGVNMYPVRFSTPLPFGVSYCYRVKAFNNAGSSEYTNEACVTND